jgi:hypothetical protein
MARTPEPVVPDLVEALGQHVLQKTADELQRRQQHRLPAMVLGILRAEADVAVLDRGDRAIGQRDPMDIPAQVAEDLVGPLHGRFTVYDPFPRPHRLGDGQIGTLLTHESPEETSEELRERLNQHEVGLTSLPPPGLAGFDGRAPAALGGGSRRRENRGPAAVPSARLLARLRCRDDIGVHYPPGIAKSLAGYATRLCSGGLHPSIHRSLLT